jgi:hypothetical protein
MVMVFVRWVVLCVWFLTRDSSVVLIVRTIEVLQSGPPRLDHTCNHAAAARSRAPDEHACACCYLQACH